MSKKVEDYTDCKHYTPEECLTRIGCEDKNCPHAVKATLKTPIIKLKSDSVVLTEEEFNRLKKIEQDYVLIRKVLED